MGQKVNAHGFRVGVIMDWDSRWYARNDKVGDLVVEDEDPPLRRLLQQVHAAQQRLAAVSGCPAGCVSARRVQACTACSPVGRNAERPQAAAGSVGVDRVPAGEAFDFDGVAAGVVEEHGPLLAGFAFEAHLGLQHKLRAGGLQALFQVGADEGRLQRLVDIRLRIRVAEHREPDPLAD